MHSKRRKSARIHVTRVALYALTTMTLGTACKRTPEPEPTRAASSTPPAVAATPPAQKPPAPGLVWPDPPGWVKGPPSPMRLATYRVPGEGGADAEMSVSHFPGGAGGNVDANFTRWIGQFEGKHADPVKTERSQGILPAHVLEIAQGTYRPMQGEPKSGQALVGAIVESPDGPYFFKLIGPVKTVEAQKKTFFSFLDGIGTPPG
jgi:hypothetical protein